MLSHPRSLLAPACLVWLATVCFGSVLRAAEVRVDFARTNGVIRPLHGVNCGPLCYRGTVDLSAYHRELGVPFTRLHDTVWLNAEAVDIHTIFRDFRDDPALPENYDFRQTDDYLQTIADVGSRLVYRLGESIEHTPHKYYVNPPTDPEKWAAICVGIARHYTEGWAGGARQPIAYWEIWNEPDVRPAMWTGTDEQFFRLFEVTAKALKARFPEAKVGGPAVGGTGEFTGETFKPTPFVTAFLSWCRDHHVPLDFFSWHRYTSDPWDLPRRAQAMRRVLDDFGFTKTESHLNEWNYLPRDDWQPLVKEGQGLPRQEWFAEMNGPAGAAFTAAALLLLLDAPVDVANYYTGEIQGFGLFDFNGVPKKTFHDFRAFRRLLDTPLRTAATVVGSSRVTAVAGVDAARREAGVTISNLDPAADALALVLDGVPWAGATEYEVLAVDAGRDLGSVAHGQLAADQRLDLPRIRPPCVVLVRLGASAGR